MAGLVNKETNQDPLAYIETIDNASKQADAKRLLTLMEEVTGNPPKIWGTGMIGYGKYTYRRKGSKEDLEWFNVGFAPRKTKITVYLTYDIGQEEELLEKLGKCKWGKGCLYINKLDDVNLDVLKTMIDKAKDSSWYS